MLSPTLTRAEIRTRSTFLGLMWALSHPGRRQPLTDAVTDPTVALQVIGETLLDLETTFYTPDVSLAYALLQTTARADSPESAAYHFYPHVDAQTLRVIAQAPVGDMLYPDRAATLVLACRLGSGPEFRLKGPGIASSTLVRIDDVPAEFWDLRARSLRYPLGWDVFLVSEGEVIGIPRTTIVERINSERTNGEQTGD